MKYPKYVFLTYGSYSDSQWWTKEEVQCSPEDIAEALLFSLAVLHFHKPSRDPPFCHLCYDATWTLAYALHNVTEDVHFDNFGSGSGGSALECDQLTSYKLSGFTPMLLKKHLLAMNFSGMSVST